jgi:NAD+ kinase
MGERRNIFFFYKQDPTHKEKAEEIIELVSKYQFKVVDNHLDAHIIVSIGNDGTFLQAVRKTGFREDCLYAGIGMDTKNFYCDFHVSDIPGMIAAMLTETIEVRKYPTIEVTIDKELSFHCLNECSIRSAIIKTLEMTVFIDDLYFETFRGDGLIVSTPTGSTAYSKSVRGAVVDPMLQCIQVSELASINNNKYRTLGSPFLLSGKRGLTLKITQDGNDYPIIGMDNEAVSIQNVQEIKVELTDKKIKTVKLKNNSFWHKVQRNFL